MRAKGTSICVSRAAGWVDVARKTEPTLCSQLSRKTLYLKPTHPRIQAVPGPMARRRMASQDGSRATMPRRSRVSCGIMLVRSHEPDPDTL